MHSKVKTVLSLIILMTFAMSAAFAGDIREKPVCYGFKAGLYSPGTYYITDFSYGEFDTDMGISLGGFLDYKLGEKIVGGLSLDYGSFGVYEESASLIDLSATLKALIYGDNSSIIIKPGFGFGYGNVGGIGSYLEGSSYLLVKGIAEIVFASQGSMSFLVELQILGALSGGNDDFEMSFGPGFLLRGGIVF